ncbi:MAG: thiol-disulfide oxidoreductase DCC family protein [Chlorobi bacterium]|nr:thiol-disulfide oxidoreductase DCC family protein [Chlorobiota bacterium]MCI0716550.1 thiol-disulfide oxidoreductase DCC family protein [Chlorobiota bacterium]
MKSYQNNSLIILFDGVCNFCNSSVNFIMSRDKKNIFKFAAIQSDPGIELQKKFGLNPNELATFIFVEGDKYYTKTTAALRVAKELKFPWNLSYFFIIIPPFIRNIAYNIIAKYRYRWFGKRNACRVPTDEEKEKFL